MRHFYALYDIDGGCIRSYHGGEADAGIGDAPGPGCGGQLDSNDTLKVLPQEAKPATLAEIRGLLQEALSEERDLTPLKGFKMDLSATADFHKLFFATRCSCKTVGLLSIEVARSKALADVRRALPQLAERLRGQARAFRAMPCEVHTRMRLGGGMSAHPEGKISIQSGEPSAEA